MRVSRIADIAALLNEHFVCIKVDREERPDLDQIYMEAVQVMSGQGGWPMSVFLTPDLEPFFGGTYWPPIGRRRHARLSATCSAGRPAWREHRRNCSSRPGRSRLLGRDTCGPPRGGRAERGGARRGRGRLAGAFDSRQAASAAPQVPAPRLAGPAAAPLEPHGPRTTCWNGHRHARSTWPRGGIYDHLGGGFHRYSIDADWLVPHFEKMLYDNALLGRLLSGGRPGHGQPTTPALHGIRWTTCSAT